jgi:hypothetical protein
MFYYPKPIFVGVCYIVARCHAPQSFLNNLHITITFSFLTGPLRMLKTYKIVPTFTILRTYFFAQVFSCLTRQFFFFHGYLLINSLVSKALKLLNSFFTKTNLSHLCFAVSLFWHSFCLACLHNELNNWRCRAQHISHVHPHSAPYGTQAVQTPYGCAFWRVTVDWELWCNHIYSEAVWAYPHTVYMAEGGYLLQRDLITPATSLQALAVS